MRRSILSALPILAIAVAACSPSAPALVGSVAALAPAGTTAKVEFVKGADLPIDAPGDSWMVSFPVADITAMEKSIRAFAAKEGYPVDCSAPGLPFACLVNQGSLSSIDMVVSNGTLTTEIFRSDIGPDGKLGK
jgi:hypothetical protein